MRRLIKSGLALGLAAGGTHRLVRWADRFRDTPRLVCYHRVLPEVSDDRYVIPSMRISRRQFEEQLDWLQRHYRLVSLDELATGEGRGKRTGGGAANGAPADVRPMAAITFDDGYRDVYEHAYPLLRERGIPAALFLITDLVGTRDVPHHDRLYVLMTTLWRREQRPADVVGRLLDALGIVASPDRGRDVDALSMTRALLTRLRQRDLLRLLDELAARFPVDDGVWERFRTVDWDMVDEMRLGGFTIGSHTRSHPMLSSESDDVVEDEVAGSRRLLELRLEVPVRHFAYPDGRFDARVVRTVARAGYRRAFSTCRHRHADLPHLTLPRKTLWENCCRGAGGHFSPSLAGAQMAGVFDWVHRCEQDHRLGDRRLAGGRTGC